MATGDHVNFELPPKVEGLLAALSSYYAKRQLPKLQKLVVNATHSVDAGVEYDNWDGGQHGHALHLRLPPEFYYEILDDVEEVRSTVCSDLNRLAKSSNEHFCSVYIEMVDQQVDPDWRERTGLLLNTRSNGTPNRVAPLSSRWKPECLRVFLSHKADYKKETAALKSALTRYGVSSFVAHEDIEPTKEWQIEIEKALLEMDALVALLTSNFSESNWTDQEIGAAVGQRVPVVPVRLGKDPYGFIGKVQAIPGNGTSAAELGRLIYEGFWRIPILHDRLAESLVVCLENASSFDHSNSLMPYIEKIGHLSPPYLERLQSAAKNNRQVREANLVYRRLPNVLARLKGESW